MSVSRALALTIAVCATAVVVAAGQTGSAEARGGAACDTNPKTACALGGQIQTSVYGDAVCTWTATISWGDGSKTTVSNYSGTQFRSHTYTKRAFYKISFSGSGRPNDPGTTCTFHPSSFVVEFPFTAAQRSVIIRTKKLAKNSRGPIKKAKRAYKKVKQAQRHHRKPPRKAVKQVGKQEKKIVNKLSKQAEQAAKDWGKDQLTKQVSARTGVGQESLGKLWTFLGKLSDLSKFPNSAVKAADNLYKRDGDFHETLDRLASLERGCTDRGWESCTPEAKRSVATASQVMIRTGSVKQFINDAAEAGKAGAQVSYTLPTK